DWGLGLSSGIQQKAGKLQGPDERINQGISPDLNYRRTIR
nr:hypothetical protein [Tanacetum cinerariifolium]